LEKPTAAIFFALVVANMESRANITTLQTCKVAEGSSPLTQANLLFRYDQMSLTANIILNMVLVSLAKPASFITLRIL